MIEDTYRLLVTTEGVWYDAIASGQKKFDFRKGIREISVGDVVCFMEANAEGRFTGRTCTFIVTLVVYSTDFPEFGWKGGDFTIIQFGDRLGSGE
jgi:hypothetical protein